MENKCRDECWPVGDIFVSSEIRSLHNNSRISVEM